MGLSNRSRTDALEAEQIESLNGMPPWVVEYLYQWFLDDYWSTGAGELSSKPLDAEFLPKEIYARAFAQRVGRRRTEDLALLTAKRGTTQAPTSRRSSSRERELSRAAG